MNKQIPDETKILCPKGLLQRCSNMLSAYLCKVVVIELILGIRACSDMFPSHNNSTVAFTEYRSGWEGKKRPEPMDTTTVSHPNGNLSSVMVT